MSERKILYYAWLRITCAIFPEHSLYLKSVGKLSYLLEHPIGFFQNNMNNKIREILNPLRKIQGLPPLPELYVSKGENTEKEVQERPVMKQLTQNTVAPGTTALDAAISTGAFKSKGQARKNWSPKFPPIDSVLTDGMEFQIGKTTIKVGKETQKKPVVVKPLIWCPVAPGVTALDAAISAGAFENEEQALRCWSIFWYPTEYVLKEGDHFRIGLREIYAIVVLEKG